MSPEQLTAEQQDHLAVNVARELKTNRYDARTQTLTLTAHQAAALQAIERFWERTFVEGGDRYGFLPNTISSAEGRRQIARFFFWTAWAAATNRPDKDYSYTNNWLPDPTVGNVPTAGTYLWTLGGVLGLFLVLGLFIYMVHYYKIWYGPSVGVPLANKLIDMPLTSSQQKAAKYFLAVILLFLVQTCFGGSPPPGSPRRPISHPSSVGGSPAVRGCWCRSSSPRFCWWLWAAWRAKWQASRASWASGGSGSDWARSSPRSNRCRSSASSCAA